MGPPSFTVIVRPMLFSYSFVKELLASAVCLVGLLSQPQIHNGIIWDYCQMNAFCPGFWVTRTTQVVLRPRHTHLDLFLSIPNHSTHLSVAVGIIPRSLNCCLFHGEPPIYMD